MMGDMVYPADARRRRAQTNLAGRGDIEERRHVELAVHHVGLKHQLAARGRVVRLPSLAHLATSQQRRGRTAWDGRAAS